MSLRPKCALRLRRAESSFRVISNGSHFHESDSVNLKSQKKKSGTCRGYRFQT